MKGLGRILFIALLILSSLPGFSQSAQSVSPNRGDFDGPAELPRVYMKSALADSPAPGRAWIVKEGGNIQDAVEKASCGDTIELQAGVTFPGRVRLPAKKCDDAHWIILRTGAPDGALPPEGTRITPCYAGVPSLPARPSFNCSSPKNVMAKLELDTPGNGTVILQDGANHYRLIGLEITRQLPGRSVRSLIIPEEGATSSYIIVDRCWLHGTAQDETNRGIQLIASSYVAIIDSYFSDFHCIAITGSCTDAQAIGGGNGNHPMGPYKIVNNFLEGAGETILFGGGPATQVPADIEIRHNHMFKPMTWKPDYPGFVGAQNGRPFIVKNLFELKNGQRVLFEGNILENSWGGFTQTGFAILLTPKNQAGKTGNLCPACQVTDVTIRNSFIHHVASCFQIGNGLSATGGAAVAGERYSIHDVICDDVDGRKYNGFGNFAQVSHQTPPLRNVKLDHITAFPPNAVLNIGNDHSGMLIANVTFTNNVMNSGQRQATSTGGGGNQNCAFQAQARPPASVLSGCFSGSRFERNVIIGGNGWPKDNFTPKNADAVKFVNFNNGDGGNYRLRPDSPYKKNGSDGRDPGADVDAIEAATAGAQ